LENADDILTDPITVETVGAVNDLKAQFENFVSEKSSKEAEYSTLGSLASKCASFGVPETTYSEVSWATIQSKWANVNGQIDSRRAQLDGELTKQQSDENLRVDFANKAASFNEWLKTQSSSIESLSGEIQQQIDQLQAINTSIGSGRGSYDELVSLTHQLDAAQVGDNPHTTLTIEGLKSSWESLNTLSNKKQKVLEQELLAQSGSGLSGVQITEFKECFKHFDKDEDNLLNRLELGACLKSLGEDVNFDAGGKLDQIISGIDGDGDGKVTFEEFVGYMERVASGSDTPDSIKAAFKTLAGDKDFVTEADLRSVLPGDKVEFILARMEPYPGVQGGYNYNTFTDKLYGH